MPAQLISPKRSVYRPIFRHAEASAESLARRVAKAAGTFEHERLGRDPSRVMVVAGRGWMVVCLQSALAPLERIVASNCEASATAIERRKRAAMKRSLDELRDYVRDRTGVELVGAMVSIDATTGSMLTTFSTSPAVDLFLLGQGLPCLGVPIDAHVHADGPHAPGAAGNHAVGIDHFVRREPFAVNHC